MEDRAQSSPTREKQDVNRSAMPQKKSRTRPRGFLSLDSMPTHCITPSMAGMK